MTFTRLLGLIATVGILGACIEDRLEVATIDVDYLTTKQAAAMAEPYLSEAGSIIVSPSDVALNTITVRDRRENVRRVQNVLNERDVSPQNVSLHFQVVRATETGRIDPQLAKVGDALRGLLRFEGYELVAQTVVSASERKVSEQSINVASLPMQLGVRINDIVGGSGSVDMEVDLRRPGHGSLLTTNVVVPMGQTVVLGSAYPGTEGEALILTVRGERGSARLRTSSRRSHDDAHAATAARAEAAAEAVAIEAAAVEELIARERAILEADVAIREIIDGRAKSAVTRGKSLGADQARGVPLTKTVVPSPTRARAKAGSVPPA